MIRHPGDLDEEVLVVGVGALGGGLGDPVSVGVDLGAQREVANEVAVEVNTPGGTGSAAPLVRLPAVGEPVAVRVVDDPVGVETRHAANHAASGSQRQFAWSVDPGKRKPRSER